MYYEPVKVTINALGLAEVIIDMVVWHYNLPDSSVTKKRLGFYLKILVIALLLPWSQTKALNCVPLSDKRSD